MILSLARYIRHGKEEKAHQVLAKVHANGNMDDEVVQVELTEIKDTLIIEKEYEANGWSELWRTPGNRHRLVILLTLGLFSQWSGNGLVSYYITKVLNGVGITNTHTQLIINGVLQICNAIIAIGQSFFVDRIGRRTLFLVSTAGMLGTFVVWTICSAQYAEHTNVAAGHAVIAFVQGYMPSYELFLDGLRQKPLVEDAHVRVVLDRNRAVIAADKI